VIVATVLMMLTGIAAARTPEQALIPSSEHTLSAAKVRSSQPELEVWRKTILKTPRPTNGCFVASYPDTQWREVSCTAPPHKLFPPRSGRGRAGKVGETVGDGADFSAQVTGTVSEAEGSFDSVSGVTSESSPDGANSYSLQLNTDFFTTTTCSGSPDPASCLGWEQFVYDTSAGISYGGFMQYWLINYGPAGTSCPSPVGANCKPNEVESDGWCPFSGSGGEVYCVVNAVNAAAAPAEPITSLSQLKVTGYAAGASGPDDSIAVSVGSEVYSASGNDYFPDLGGEWQDAEFNVFGDGGGDEATFNSGSTMVVRTSVDSGVTSGPACDETGFTGETNNLILVDTTEVPAKSEFPSLVFTESDASGSVAVGCGGAVSVAGLSSATATPTATSTATRTSTPTSTWTSTATATQTATATTTTTVTPTATATSTPTTVATPTSTATATQTATSTATATARATATSTPTATTTATQTATASATPTPIASRTATPSASATPTPTPTVTTMPTATPTPVGTLSISPNPVNFGDSTAEGKTSKPKKVTIKNISSKSSKISVMITGEAASSGFGIKGAQCTKTLKPGKSCKIEITFSPKDTTQQSGTLTVHDDAQGAPQTVTLSGTGKAPK
jgi:Abnormal spindle-like microcephaly-assoc'd, ASPM-SPD-2-Hydin